MPNNDSGQFHRISGSAVQTAAVTLRNKSGRLVHIIGMSHIANPRYWKEINHVIHKYDSHGWQIHFERVKPITDQQLRSLAPAEREMLDGIHSVLNGNYGFGKSSKLVFQGDVLKLPPTAVNTDTDMATLVQSLAQGQDVHVMQQVMALVSKLPRTLRKMAALIAFMPGVEPGESSLTKVLKDDRNHIALSEIDNTSDNVLMLWGAAHLPGICQGLATRGFSETDRQWHTVFTVGELFAP